MGDKIKDGCWSPAPAARDVPTGMDGVSSENTETVCVRELDCSDFIGTNNNLYKHLKYGLHNNILIMSLKVKL